MCTFEDLGDNEKTCVGVIAWRGRLDDCGGWPAPSDLGVMIAEAPACLARHGSADDQEILSRLMQLEEYQARHWPRRA